jgi:tRNA pseudouridine55 synthase
MIGEERKKIHNWSRSELHGLIPVNKEVGPTSHEIVNRLRNILRYRKIGHTGTLDPAACGLLLTCLGKGCKIVQFLFEWDKEYLAEIKLGQETDTYDVQGRVIKKKNNLDLSEDEIEKAIFSFKGENWQVSPAYSALKFKGKKLYQYAREGETAPKKLKKIKITEIKIKDINLPIVKIEVTCTSGTYIRTLAHDIGKKLGCGACLSSLCRTRLGPFQLEDALTLQKIQKEKERISNFYVSLENVLGYLPSLVVKDNFKNRIKNGMELKSSCINSVEKDFKPGERLTLKDESGKILAIGDSLVSSKQIFHSENEKNIFKYKRVLI